jgi:NAD(P)-dependent dehydrogenase (short-subunit alcohol dehydrogenase family)
MKTDQTFAGKVAIITGAGRGLGAAYARELARRGASVVVNDPGGAPDGQGADAAPAQQVVDAIHAEGGTAIAHGADIVDRAQANDLVAAAREAFGAVHILINNAGIVRDRTFAKKDLDDFRAVVDVHLWGTFNVSRAVWPIMIEQGYGRILVTSSISGTLGSFGQADYAAAKTGVLGLMNTLALEGARYDIRVNAVSPAAATRITEGVVSVDAFNRLKPELVVPAALHLVGSDAPTKVAIQAGGGQFSRVVFAQTPEVDLGQDVSLEDFAAAYSRIADLDRLSEVRAPETQS